MSLPNWRRKALVIARQNVAQRQDVQLSILGDSDGFNDDGVDEGKQGGDATTFSGSRKGRGQVVLLGQGSGDFLKSILKGVLGSTAELGHFVHIFV